MRLFLKKILQLLFRGGILVLLFIAGYLFFAVILSLVPVNRNTSTGDDLDIFIRSNGVHLELLLPASTPDKDWLEELKIDKQLTDRVRYISFGWGDRNFYLHTPEWSDLTFSTAFTALLRKSPSAMHIDYYSTVSTGRLCKKISISNEQYRRIVSFVDAAFQRNKNGQLIEITDLHYTPYDVFYEATGSYHLFYTCNSWTNQCLKISGLKASLWTPFDRGTLFHYRKE